MQKVYTKIESIVGNVVTVRAEGVKYGDLALVGDSYATVIKLDKDLVSLQVFAGAQGVGTSDEVRFLGKPMMVSFSDNLLGRIFDGAGVPRDNGPALTENMIPIGGPSFNPSKRILPNKMIRTGIPMIDLFNTLVESQKLPIFSISGEPYNQLLARIALQAEVDVIILGGMGLKYDDYLTFRDTLEKGGVMGHTVMCIRPNRRMYSGTGPGSGGCRAVRTGRKESSGTAHRYDQLRRCPEGNGDYDGAGTIQPWISGRSLLQPCFSL